VVAYPTYVPIAPGVVDPTIKVDVPELDNGGKGGIPYGFRKVKISGADTVGVNEN